MLCVVVFVFKIVGNCRHYIYSDIAFKSIYYTSCNYQTIE